MTLRQRSHRRLQNTNMGFHAAQQKCVASVKTGDAGAELAIAETAELQLIQRCNIRQQGSDLRNCLAESPGILSSDNHRKREKRRRANQKPAVAHQTFLFMNGRQKFFLDIYDNQRALLSVQHLAGNFTGRWKFREGSDHKHYFTSRSAVGFQPPKRLELMA